MEAIQSKPMAIIYLKLFGLTASGGHGFVQITNKEPLSFYEKFKGQKERSKEEFEF